MVELKGQIVRIMATRICPKCEEDTFTWRMDEEISDLTIWSCYSCYYQAFENETDIRKCKRCETISESKLKDDSLEYYWCSNCGGTEIIKNYT